MVRVVPEGVGLPPIWLLGSSGASASLAGRLGLGYSFASHFSHTSPLPAVEAYRREFRPSEAFPEPRVILAAAVVCAETDERADYLASTMDLVWVRLRRGELGPIPSPEEARSYPYTAAERALVDSYRALAVIGTPDRVLSRLRALASEAGADEVMVSSNIYDPVERLRSYALLRGGEL